MARVYDIIKTEQDLTYLSWDEVSSPSGLIGPRAKAREGSGSKAVYYKQHHRGELGRAYHDCFAELICNRLYQHLGFDYIPHQLINAKIDPDEPAQWVIRTRSYRKAGERSISLSVFHEISGIAGETPLRLCKRMGWDKKISDMIVADFITATRSRDEACFEVIADRSGNLRPSPLVPRSYSLANAFPKQTWRTHATADVSTSNYLGTRSLKDNLILLPDDYQVPPYDEAVCDALFTGLYEIAPDKAFLDASRQILERRWQLLEDIRSV